MNKKEINKLIASSYKGDYLNKNIINKIASHISRTDLKKYINALKLVEKKRTLVVSSPINNSYAANFKKLFPNKKIIFKKDPSLMLGTRVVDNDIVYEFTLKNSFDRILNYIEQNYD